MASLEKISANLKLTESKKNDLRKAILWLTLEWKDFEEHLDSTQGSFRECFDELESREKHLHSIQESISESNKDLNLIQNSIESRLREVENKEKEFHAFQEEQIEDFELKEKQLGLVRKSVEARIEEVKSKEKTLDATQKLVEGLFDKLALEIKQFEPIQKLIDERFKEIGLKGEYFENRTTRLNSVQNWIERRAKELDTKEEQLEERGKELELKERNLGSVQKELELKEKEVECAQESNEKRAAELESREKQLNSVKKFTQDCFKEFQSKKKQCQLEQKLFEERVKDIELREKQVEDRVKEFGSKGKQFSNAIDPRVKTEPVENLPGEIDCLSADIRFVVTMDGKSLQMFLNGRGKDHELMAEEVYKALRLSPDPSKLVLDAMEGFYPPHLKKENVEFEGNVVRSSCILLLEQLMRILPQIQPHVREAALRLAGEWKAKMVVGGKKSLDVLGLLHLLASYGLASAFDEDELLNLVEIVAEHRQTPELCRLLGFTENIPEVHWLFGCLKGDGSSCMLRVLSRWLVVRRRQRWWLLVQSRLCGDPSSGGGGSHLLGVRHRRLVWSTLVAFVVVVVAGHWRRRLVWSMLVASLDAVDSKDLVQNLIRKQQHLVAIRFICSFGLVNKFPPVPIMKDYLKQVKNIAKSMRKKDNSRKAQNQSTGKRVAAMRAVMKCIVDHKLESLYSPKILEKCIGQLIMQNAGKKFTASSATNKALKRQQIEMKRMSVITATIAPKAMATAPDPRRAIANVCSPATNMAVILANMDGKNLQLFLSEHLEEHEFIMHEEVFSALQMLFDPARLVLDAMQGFYSPHSDNRNKDFGGNVIRRSCILLLEQLVRLSPTIKPQTKEEAIKLAFDWKEKMRAKNENCMEIMGFLLLIGAYGLAFAFDADELLNLFKIVAQFRHAPELCEALGFSDNVHVSGILHPEATIGQFSSENLCSGAVASSSMGQRHDFEFLCTTMDRKGEELDSMWNDVPASIRHASDPAKLVLDALQCCYYSKLKRNNKFVMTSFVNLLEQLMRISPGIMPQVKESAMKFSVDWRAELDGPRMFPMEVLGFLQLLATYKLAAYFDANDLLDLLDAVHQQKQTTNLFQVLGLADKIPSFIHNLIGKGRRLQAIRYIYAFQLVDIFPPVPLLQSHLIYSEQLAKKKCEEGHNSPVAQYRATNNEITALRAVIKCILDHGLESEYSVENLKARIAQLERQRDEWKISMLCPSSKVQCQQNETKTSPPASLLAAIGQPQLQDTIEHGPAAAVNSKAESHQKPAQKRRRVDISVEAMPTTHLGSAYPTHSEQTSSRYTGGWFTEQDGPYSRAPLGHYSLGSSTPIMPHTSHLEWQYGSDASPNWGTRNFGFSGGHFGVAANLNDQPSMMDERQRQYSNVSWQVP
ncbi:unnamed protein product [Ilex paraguariensis]|uniref:FRIGIDA-like protein n=1 Tax=Ilex paraguariensis TaxID=185542 RepID=A0ABC8S4Q0_9AQUA